MLEINCGYNYIEYSSNFGLPNSKSIQFDKVGTTFFLRFENSLQRSTFHSYIFYFQLELISQTTSHQAENRTL